MNSGLEGDVIPRAVGHGAGVSIKHAGDHVSVDHRRGLGAGERWRVRRRTARALAPGGDSPPAGEEALRRCARRRHTVVKLDRLMASATSVDLARAEEEEELTTLRVAAIDPLTASAARRTSSRRKTEPTAAPAVAPSVKARTLAPHATPWRVGSR